MDFYSVEGKDLEGIVSQLRLTAGVEVAIFIYEMQTQLFKVSLRSNGKVDVSKIAVFSEAADMCVQPAVICRAPCTM